MKAPADARRAQRAEGAVTSRAHSLRKGIVALRRAVVSAIKSERAHRVVDASADALVVMYVV